MGTTVKKLTLGDMVRAKAALKAGLILPTKARGSVLERQFAMVWRGVGGPVPVPEFRFCATRRWRFDFAWPEAMLAVEVEGGHWAQGRHTRGSGFEGDAEKYLEATLGGWTVLRLVSKQLTVPVLERIRAELVRRTRVGVTDVDRFLAQQRFALTNEADPAFRVLAARVRAGAVAARWMEDGLVEWVNVSGGAR